VDECPVYEDPSGAGVTDLAFVASFPDFDDYMIPTTKDLSDVDDDDFVSGGL